jgi:hypothetical protein
MRKLLELILSLFRRKKKVDSDLASNDSTTDTKTSEDRLMINKTDSLLINEIDKFIL